MHLYKYNVYQAYKEISESIESILQDIDVDSIDAIQIQDLVSNQEEIFSKYSMTPAEIDNIKSGIADSIRVKLGMG